MSLTVNAETIRLNEEAVKLAAVERRIIADANNLWVRIQKDLIRHQELMLELGAARLLQDQKEKELREAVEKG